jgi:DNA-binding protein HU-beta
VSSNTDVNKSELTSHLAQELRTSKLAAARLLDTVLAGVRKGLREDGSVTITGFGTFEVKERKARIGRNPHTGEPIQIQAGKRVGFRVGKGLKQMV